jgi:hypothetical protein
MTEDDGKLDLVPAKKVDTDAEARRKGNLVKAGIGIGSAALVAALIYANRNRKNKPVE